MSGASLRIQTFCQGEYFLLPHHIEFSQKWLLGTYFGEKGVKNSRFWNEISQKQFVSNRFWENRSAFGNTFGKARR